MIKQEKVKIGEREFLHTYSDKKFYILQVETSNIYDEAYDIYDAEEIGWCAKCKCDKNCLMYKKLHTRIPKEKGNEK